MINNSKSQSTDQKRSFQIKSHDKQPFVPALPKFLQWIVDNPARAAVVIFVVLMIYQATLPSGLSLDPATRTISWNIIPSENYDLSRADVVGNIVPYFIFGHFLFLASWRRRPVWKRVLLITFIGTCAMALAVEFVQYFNLYRGSAIWDMISGIIGAFMALVTGCFYVTFISGFLNKWVKREIKSNPLLVAAAFFALVICWDSARPFYVISSANTLFDNIKRSHIIPFDPRERDIREQLGLYPSSNQQALSDSYTADYFGSVAERLLTYTVLFGLLAASQSKKRFKKVLTPYFVIVFLAELISLGIVHGGVDMTHVAIGVIAIPIAFVGVFFSAKKPRQGLMMLLFVFLLYVLISDLRPYLFAGMEKLSVEHFIPLLHHFRNPDVMVLANIVESIVVYAPVGMLVYLLLFDFNAVLQQKKWPSLLLSCVVCGVIGLLLEVIQLWIPARTAGIEDVIYAILGGYVGGSAARLFYFYTLRNSESLQVNG